MNNLSATEILLGEYTGGFQAFQKVLWNEMVLIVALARLKDSERNPGRIPLKKPRTNLWDTNCDRILGWAFPEELTLVSETK